MRIGSLRSDSKSITKHGLPPDFAGLASPVGAGGLVYSSEKYSGTVVWHLCSYLAVLLCSVTLDLSTSSKKTITK